MTLCPIAIAVGNKKCPAFSVCPLKGAIGGAKKEEAPAAKAGEAPKKKRKRCSAELIEARARHAAPTRV